jgi:hypothetical protein
MKKTLFIRNAKKVDNSSKEPNLLFIRNTTTAETRKDVLDGRNYLVVPCVMIVEGVHNGSQGSLFYSEAELSKFVCCWNMKPVLLRHPDTEDSGTDVSVLRNQGVGILLNTEFTDGKLKTEVWIDEEKANTLDSRIVSRIENDEKIEVSTGLFTELDLNAGVWNGESFESNTLNYRPDHLAILLDSTGACSIDDGAGLLQNKESKTTNELNHSQIHEQLNNLIREANLTDDWTWVMDVYDKYFIYEQKDNFFRQDYLVSSDDVVTLSGESVEVKREVKYKPVTNNKESKMLTREELVAKLIANTAFHFTDAKGLEGFSDELLGKMVANSEPKEDDVAPVANVVKEGDENVAPVENTEVTPATKGSQVVAESVKNNDTTLEAFLASAPKEIAEVLN